MVHPMVKNVEFDMIEKEIQWAVVNILLMISTTKDILQKHMKIFGLGIVFTWVKLKVTNLSKVHHQHYISSCVKYLGTQRC